MRTYNELVIEFSTWGSEGKQKWVDKLPIEELKTLRKGLINVAYTGIWDSWINYIDLTISLKIEEERERKLNELGI
jgi:hypothetical protein